MSSAALDAVREQVPQIEAVDRVAHGTLAFGVEVIDARLPGGGLARGALHEVAGGGNGAVHAAAAALFAAGIMARTSGKILWCVTRRDLFAPAMSQAGLHPDRVIYAEVGDEKSVLACFEEGLRHGGMAGVVGEVAKLSMTASRRLQLVAESSGTMAIATRRWRRMTEASDFGQAAVCGHHALAITDRNSLSGIVRAHEAAKVTGVRPIVGCRLILADGSDLLVYPTDRPAYVLGKTLGVPLFQEQAMRVAIECAGFRVQREGEVVHVVVMRLHDLSGELASLGEREAAFPLPHGRGDEFHHGSVADTLEVKARDFR